MLIGTLFFWWSQRLLLGSRIAWTALLPGAAATMLGLLGLRVFSQLVFSPLIASNAVTYGPFGTVLVIQSWLLGVASWCSAALSRADCSTMSYPAWAAGGRPVAEARS
ncbi:hypothetical protein [Streptomyces sp. NPDC048269]|uniref:hypothetical protein n=1 Tax=Streptomyces sp. NPDC048269 TaxID=3155753 RepID=UPI0034174BBE